jgi:hypothetical protein
MKPLKPLPDIFVPDPRPDEVYTTTVLDRSFTFTGLKALRDPPPGRRPC